MKFIPPTAGPVIIPSPQATDIIDMPTAWLVLSEVSYRIVLAVPTVPTNKNKYSHVHNNYTVYIFFFHKLSTFDQLHTTAENCYMVFSFFKHKCCI